MEPLLRRRSRLVAHRPPRPLVQLSQISGPVRSFFLFLPVLGVFSCLSACCDGSWVRWEASSAGLGLFGRAKADSKGLLSAPGAGCVPSRAAPWG